MRTSTVSVVVGGQFGSEAKGHVTARLVGDDRFRKDGGHGGNATVVRVAGPNAGHSAVGLDGRLWALRQVPVGMVADEHVTGMIAAGSEIDQEVLESEIQGLEDAGHKIRQRLVIDSEATLLEDTHKQTEREEVLTERVGSTGKGIGAARADRLLRNAVIIRELHEVESSGTWLGCDVADDTSAHLRYVLANGGHHVVIEGTQGYGLGLHAGFYPFCTSSDCRAIDFLAMTGVNPWDPAIGRLDVWVVLRPFPIRVAGNSGPLAKETTWEDLGLPPEFTTVTKKQRRVGHWDPMLARRAVAANGGPSVKIALTMADQVLPGAKDKTAVQDLAAEDLRDFTRWVAKVERDAGAKVRMVTTGPDAAVAL